MEDVSRKPYQNISKRQKSCGILICFLKYTIRHGGRGTKNVPPKPRRWRETSKEAHVHGRRANMAEASRCTPLTNRSAEGGETRRGVATKIGSLTSYWTLGPTILYKIKMNKDGDT